MALPRIEVAQAADHAALLARLRAGDERAFDTIFRTWYPPLVRFGTRILGERARAEEVVQDALLELWRRRELLDPEGTAQGWLFRTVRNRSLNVIRHDDTVARSVPHLSAERSAAEQDASLEAEDAMVESELHQAIDDAVASLPPRCRTVFVMSRRQGMKNAEIAEALGIGVKAVEAQITRALRELRVALAPWMRNGMRP